MTKGGCVFAFYKNVNTLSELLPDLITQIKMELDLFAFTISKTIEVQCRLKRLEVCQQIIISKVLM